MTDHNTGLTEIIKVAAYLAQGAGLPSYDKDDHNRHVPAWLLTEIEKAADDLKVQATALKRACDSLRSALTTPPAPTVMGDDVREAVQVLQPLVDAWEFSSEITFAIKTLIRAATQPPQAYPSGLQKATVHVLLDTLAAAARGETLDPETCQQIEGIAKEYNHKDFTEDDVLALYGCGHRPQQHPDDAAVDAFATRMKEKLAKKRAEGRGGWEDKTQCSAEFLSQLLREHVIKGDPVDVANFAMMLSMRDESISPSFCGVLTAF